MVEEVVDTSNENLVAVNETSKRINDASIEMFITKKGAIHISHVSLLESNLLNNSTKFIV